MTALAIQYEWAALVINKALDPDGHYGNQCVDTVDHYGQYIFRVPWQQCVGGVNGARNLLDVAPDEYWERIDYYHGFIPQQFDVLVFDGDSLNQFGHTAICWWANATTINVIQQDGFARPWKFVDGNWYSDKPAHYYTLNYRQDGTGPLAGVLRPRREKMVQSSGDIILSGQIIEPTQEIDVLAKDEIIGYIQTIFFGKYSLGGRDDNPGLAYALVNANKKATEAAALAYEANVKVDRLTSLVAALPTNIWWNVTVERENPDGTKYKVPALQELANLGTNDVQDRKLLLEIAGMPAAAAEVELQKVFAELAQRIDPKPEEKVAA